MRRELRVVATEAVVGAVEVDDRGGVPTFDGAAGPVFERMREREGAGPLAARLLADGWSNGYLYLADAIS